MARSAPSDASRLDAGIARVMQREPGVVAAWVFGSEARGDARPDSDLDVGLLVGERAPSALDWYARESDTYVRSFDFLPTWKLAQRHAADGIRRRLEALR